MLFDVNLLVNIVILLLGPFESIIKCYPVSAQ